MSAEPRSVQSSEADQTLVLNLAAAIRTAGYHDAKNEVMQQVCSTLAAQLGERMEQTGFLRIGVHSHSVFVGEARVRTSVLTHTRFAYLNQVFAWWGINALTFHSGMSEGELTALMLVLARERGDGPDELAALLGKLGVERIDAELLASGGVARVIAPVEAYAAAVQIGERLRESANNAEYADVRLVRHVTQAVVDQLVEAPGALIALTTIKELDGELISHSANVAILSVLLGERLGLGKARLGELCLAAFLHDAGKLEVASDVLDKAGPLDRQEWEEMRSHPIAAARALLGARQLTAAGMRAVVVAYEHHLNYDMSGYPASKIRDHISLFGNIVTIADRYDALTTARRYRQYNLTPHEVVTYLMLNAGTYFDPMLVKLFIEMIGLFPPGTLVVLNSGEVGVVCEPPAVGEPLDRPKVRVWRGRRQGEVVDLGWQEDGTHPLSISLVLNPAGQGQVPAMELLAFE